MKCVEADAEQELTAAHGINESHLDRRGGVLQALERVQVFHVHISPQKAFMYKADHITTNFI